MQYVLIFSVLDVAPLLQYFLFLSSALKRPIHYSGNFAHVHTEWAGDVGTGWSPAATISSLLVTLQMVVVENVSKRNAAFIDQFRESCLRSNRAIESLPEVIRAPGFAPSFPSVEAMGGISLSPDAQPVRDDHQPADQQITEEGRKGCPDVTEGEAKSVETDIVERDIYCWHSRASYTEDVLGYGIKIEMRTHGELCTFAAPFYGSDLILLIS